MNEIPFDFIVLLASVLGTIFVTALALLRLSKPRKPAEPSTTHNPYADEFSFEEVSKKSDLIFRCPNSKCRAYFKEPKLVVDWMVNGRDASKRYEVCPKCGTKLNPKKEEEKKEEEE